MPNASAFLWNERMLLQATCRGYITSQFMQPEPAKYSHPPTMEAKTFFQPEQPYYTHHPARFVYVKDEENGELFSAPYEPVRKPPDAFAFQAKRQELQWDMTRSGIKVSMRLALPRTDAVELWTVTVENESGVTRDLSVYPYFTVGYMS